MKHPFKKSLQSIVALVLIAAMQFPLANKVSHAIFEHVDVECNDLGSLHVHQVEFECEFQKYNLSTNYILPQSPKTFQEVLVVRENNFSTYSFLSKYQKLHFSLRGPPSFS